MIPTHLFPLTLADTDDLVKIVIGVVFALIWIIAQVVAGAKKSRETAIRRLRPEIELPPTAIDPQLDPATQLERHLQARREDAQRHRAVPRQPVVHQALPPHLQPLPPAQSYDEMRRRLQQQLQPAPAAQVKRKRPAKRHPRPEVAAEVVAPIVAGLTRPGTLSVGATEIGRDERRPRHGADKASVRRIYALLEPRSVRDVILAGELLRPPVALRDGER